MQGQWMAPGLKTDKWDSITLPVSVADNPLGAPVASIWFRKEVEIPAAWVGKALVLHLGVLDAVDECYVNGARVGRTWFDTPNYWGLQRTYPVPVVDDTHVVVAMRLLKLAYHMAPFGPAVDMKLAPPDAPDAQPVSLAGAWRVRKAQDLDAGLQPQLTPIGAAAPGSSYGHPAVQYNALIHPLIPYAIRGAIWYQGEANAPFYIDYRTLLPGLISAWRNEWGQGDFPFGIVQLASYYEQQTAPVDRGGYINLREAQAMALRVPGAFMATAMDIGEGNNIHPRNKQEVGRRLALNALQVVYGRKDVLGTGPMYKSMKIEGHAIRLRFTAAQGLYAKGDPPVGFAIAGADRAFYFAQAKIDGEEVVVWSDKVPHPVAVRYAWATNPVCNLYNAADMPIYPFHTDNWDLSQLVIPKDTITIPTGWVPR
jgi:sialate O-acetylesterase